MDEAKQYRALQKGFRDLVKHIEAVGKPPRGQRDFVGHVAKALGRLPPGDLLASRLEELREEANRFVREGRAARKHAYAAYLAAFLSKARETETFVRETSGGWRVGELELQMKPAESKVRAFYNRMALAPWVLVKDDADLAALVKDARKKLEAYRLPAERLSRSLWNAYTRLEEERRADKADDPRRVPILDLYRELRLELFREQLVGKGSHRTVAHAEFPLVAFCHNLDAYRSSIESISEGQRLSFETCSQREVSQKKAIVLGGLDGAVGYSQYGYARRVSGR